MKTLVVVDMQNDFVDGSLGTKEAVQIVEAVAEKVRKEHEAGTMIIATMDTHGEDYMNTHEGKCLPVPHCIQGTTGWQIVPAVMKELEGCLMVPKGQFGSPLLPDLIRKQLMVSPLNEKQLEIELIGLCTDICVVSNALVLRMAFPESTITVDAGCCAGVTPEKHRAALETMRSCQINIEGE